MTPPTPFFAPRRAPSRFRYVRKAGGSGNPKTATLTEDFSAALDGAKWSDFLSNVTGGQLQGDIATGMSIDSVGVFEMIGSSAFCEFVQVPSGAATSTEMILGFGYPNASAADAVRIEWFNSTLLMRLRTGGSNNDTSIAYDAVAHRFVRIREDGGTVYWDTSPDGTTWTNRRSAASTWDLTRGSVQLKVATFGSDTGTVIFDNLSLTPAAAVAPVLVFSPTRRARRPLAPRSGSTAERIQGQAVVASPNPPTSDARRAARRFVQLPRRDRSGEVVPPQSAPPPETVRRRVRGFVTRRRGRVEVVPTQIVVTPPAYAPDTRRRVARGFASRRRRSVEVIPPQIVVTPPATPTPETRRAARRFLQLPRRDRSVEVIPPQTQPPAEIRRHSPRGFVARRRNQRVEVVPPQIVVTPPTYVPTVPAKHNLRGVTRRGRRAEVVPAQATAVAPRLVPAIPPKRVLRGVPRRGRRADAPPAQTPAPWLRPRRALRGLVRRVGHAVGLIAPTPTGTLGAGDVQVTLTAAVYDRTLTAQIYTRTLTATDIY